MKSAIARKNIEPNDKSKLSALQGQVRNLDFIFEMLVELRKMAVDTDEKSLTYFLEMAALEAGVIRDSAKFEEDALTGEG